MPVELFANNVSTTLSGNGGSIGSGATSLKVASATGFPAAATGVSQFRVLIESEIIIVTNVATVTWTITRGAEGTTAATHVDGTAVTHVLTAGAIANLPTTAYTVVSKSGNYTAQPGEAVEVDATSGNVSITVSAGANAVNIVKKMDSSAHTVTILPSAGQIDGGASVVLTTQYSARETVGDGTKVNLVGERKPFGSPAALGGASTDGILDSISRSDHVHDTAGVTGAIIPVTVAAMGTTRALTLSGTDLGVVDGTLDQASCAISFVGFPASRFAEMVVRLHQDATGGRAITFSDTINWIDGYAPVLASAANAVTQFLIFSEDGGTTLIGSHGQKIRTHTYHVNGPLIATTGKDRDYFENDARVVKVRMSVGDTPVTTPAVVDLKKNGTTLYTTTGNRPSVAAGGNTAVATLPDVQNIAAGTYLTLDVVTPSGAGYLAVAVMTVEAA